MQDLGIKGQSQNAMLALPDDRKWFLIHQNDNTSSSSPRSVARQHTGAAGPNAPTSAGASEQEGWSFGTLTGGLAHRFSVASITGRGEGEPGKRDSISGHGSPQTANSTLFGDRASDSVSSRPLSDSEFVQAQKTGMSEVKTHHTGSSAGASATAAAAASLWQNWWGGGAATGPESVSSMTTPTTPSSSSNHATAFASGTAPIRPSAAGGNASASKNDPERYAHTLLTAKGSSRKDLVKHLISLRVTLSSAKLVWIADFLDADGLLGIEKVLGEETNALVDTAKRKERKDMSDVVISECVKCLRTLMNTEVREEETGAKEKMDANIRF